MHHPSNKQDTEKDTDLTPSFSSGTRATYKLRGVTSHHRKLGLFGISITEDELFTKMKWGHSKMGKLIDGITKLQESNKAARNNPLAACLICRHLPGHRWSQVTVTRLQLQACTSPVKSIEPNGQRRPGPISQVRHGNKTDETNRENEQLFTPLQRNEAKSHKGEN